MQLRGRATVCAVVLSAVALAPGLAQAQQPSGRPQQGQAGLRIAHMAPGAPGPVDVFVDGQKVLSNVAYQQTSDLQSVAPGQRQIKVTAAGQTDPAVVQTNVNLEADKTTTIVAYGKQGEVKGLTTVDDLSATPEGSGRLNFVHTIPDVGRVDVYDQNNQRLFENVDYGTATDFKQAPAGAYQLKINPQGSTSTILTIANVNVPSRGSASAFSTGRGDIAGVPVQQQPGAPQPQLPQTGAGVSAPAANTTSLMALALLAVAVTVTGAGVVRLRRDRA